MVKNRFFLVVSLSLILCLSLGSTVLAHSLNSSALNLQAETKDNSVQDVGVNYATASISLSNRASSTTPSVWYSGKLTSANKWTSASLQMTLQWMSFIGPSFRDIKVQEPVESANTKSMETPTYIGVPEDGYLRAKNTVKAYFPPNILPSYFGGNTYSKEVFFDASVW